MKAIADDLTDTPTLSKDHSLGLAEIDSNCIDMDLGQDKVSSLVLKNGKAVRKWF